jgi:hypothetical protein
MEQTKQQRSVEKMAPATGPLFILFVVIIVAAAFGSTGCASLTTSKEERLANSCYMAGGRPAVSYSETTGRVDCK